MPAAADFSFIFLTTELGGVIPAVVYGNFSVGIDYQPVLPAKQTIAPGRILWCGRDSNRMNLWRRNNCRACRAPHGTWRWSVGSTLNMCCFCELTTVRLLVLYGFYDFQLTDPVSFASSDMIGNHDLLYYDEPEFARRHYSMSRYDAAGFEMARHFPFLAERGTIAACDFSVGYAQPGHQPVWPGCGFHPTGGQ